MLLDELPFKRMEANRCTISSSRKRCVIDRVDQRCVCKEGRKAKKITNNVDQSKKFKKDAEFFQGDLKLSMNVEFY